MHTHTPITHTHTSRVESTVITFRRAEECRAQSRGATPDTPLAPHPTPQSPDAAHRDSHSTDQFTAQSSTGHTHNYCTSRGQKNVLHAVAVACARACAKFLLPGVLPSAATLTFDGVDARFALVGRAMDAGDPARTLVDGARGAGEPGLVARLAVGEGPTEDGARGGGCDCARL